MSTTVTQAPSIPGLSAAHQDIVRKHVETIMAKSERNRLRRKYYDHRAALKDLGIALPPHLKSRIETAVGWPAKPVDARTRRTILDGFTLPTGTDPDSLGVAEVVERNRLSALLPQACASALIGSVAFTFVTAGDTAAGEPEALVTARSSEFATGTWSPRLWSLTDALSIVSIDDNGVPDHMVLYVPNLAVVMRREGTRWDIRQSVHDLGVPVEPIPYRAMLDRPFGRSAISRTVMSLTDSMVRTLLRTEIGAEFYNAPQRWAMGADEKAFVGSDGSPRTGWQVVLGHLLALSRDENGDLPEVGQFAQQSMEPNIAQMRALAQQFSAETNVPLRDLGVVGDNPESEGAILTANEGLELDIRLWQDSSLTPALKRTMSNALRIYDDSPAARAEYARLMLQWRNPMTVSTAASGDWLVKVAPVVPRLAETTVGLEMAGLTPEQVARYQGEVRRLSSRDTLAALVATGRQGAAVTDADEG